MPQKFHPGPRPTNLPAAVTKGQKCPLKVPEDPADAPTFEWLEKLRDHHEKNGELLTIDGMYDYARGLFDGDDLDALMKQIDRFYGAEDRAKAAPAKKLPTPKAAKTAKPVKEKAVATATKATKKVGKPVPKASTNGKHKAPAKKAAAPRPAPATGKAVFERVVNGLKVLVRSVSGQYRGTINDHPMRGILRMYGAKGKTPGEAQAALARAMKGWKSGEDYAAAMVEEGHVGSGAKEANGEKGSFGPAPEKLVNDKATVKALLGLCK